MTSVTSFPNSPYFPWMSLQEKLIPEAFLPREMLGWLQNEQQDWLFWETEPTLEYSGFGWVCVWGVHPGGLVLTERPGGRNVIPKVGLNPGICSPAAV